MFGGRRLQSASFQTSFANTRIEEEDFIGKFWIFQKSYILLGILKLVQLQNVLGVVHSYIHYKHTWVGFCLRFKLIILIQNFVVYFKLYLT